MRRLIAGAITGTLALAAPSAPAQDVYAGADHKEAMNVFNWMHGVWRGTATGTDQTGTPYELTQTERVGPMLDGDILVIEGRGYDAAGATQFNAFGVISYLPREDSYEMRSYTGGRQGTYAMEPSDDGYVWTIPLPQDAEVQYTASFDGETWTETGHYIGADGTPRKIFEMVLTRIADTPWPAGGAVAAD